MFKHRDNRDYLELNQIPYFVHLFNWKENTIKCTKNSGFFVTGEHRGLYGVLLFDRFMKHSIHNNLTDLDYSCGRMAAF